MLLSPHNIAWYLINQGHMPIGQLVDGLFRVDNSDSRNKNFIVNKDSDPAYFIKYVELPDQDKTRTLRTEATCYWLAANDPQYAGLKPYLPEYHVFDERARILVIGYARGFTTLQSYYAGSGPFSPAVPRILGDILLSYHKHLSIHQGESRKLFQSEKPWVFTLGDPSAHVATASEKKAMAQIHRLISDHPHFMELIAAQEQWWRDECLVHNDVKFANFLVRQPPEEKLAGDEKPDILLADWELASLGDPCWDAAAVLQSYLLLWLNSEPNGSRPPPALQSSMQTFWDHYASGMGYSADQLQKTIRFCALKLIHSCFETTPHTQSLEPVGARLLQMSYNILKDPAAARDQLFGISYDA